MQRPPSSPHPTPPVTLPPHGLASGAQEGASLGGCGGPAPSPFPSSCQARKRSGDGEAVVHLPRAVQGPLGCFSKA